MMKMERGNFINQLGLWALLLAILGPAWAAEKSAPEENGEPEVVLPLEIEPGEAEEIYEFDDSPRQDKVRYPAWFHHQVEDLGEVLRNLREEGKTGGLILYFGQAHCAYCDQLISQTINRDDVTAYIRRYFEVVAVDVQSDEMLTTLEGKTLTQAEFARQAEASLTPALLFYTPEGKEVLRLRGFYPPYIIFAALDYMVARRYRVDHDFRDYLARSGRSPSLAGRPGLNQHPLFMPPPYLLNTLNRPPDRPLVVFFEQRECHACDVLHRQLLTQPKIERLLSRMELVQLNVHSDLPLITPAGERTTVGDWVQHLDIFYTPTMIFFDHRGREVFRIDSVVHLFRLRTLLSYVLNKGYETHPDDVQGWFFSRPERFSPGMNGMRRP